MLKCKESQRGQRQTLVERHVVNDWKWGHILACTGWNLKDFPDANISFKQYKKQGKEQLNNFAIHGVTTSKYVHLKIYIL